MTFKEKIIVAKNFWKKEWKTQMSVYREIN